MAVAPGDALTDRLGVVFFLEGAMMSCSGRLAACVLILVVGLAATGRAAAIAPQIKDDGKFFSPETVKKLNTEIREIYGRYRRDVVVETIATLPEDQKNKLASMSNEEKNRYWRHRADDRAEELVMHGVLILACKEPAHLQVVVTQKEQQTFSRQDQEKLVNLLLTKFRQKQFDDGLTDAVKYIRERLAAAAK
jgi:uncharacterized membrane protein YgcG